MFAFVDCESSIVCGCLASPPRLWFRWVCSFSALLLLLLWMNAMLLFASLYKCSSWFWSFNFPYFDRPCFDLQCLWKCFCIFVVSFVVCCLYFVLGVLTFGNPYFGLKFWLIDLACVCMYICIWWGFLVWSWIGFENGLKTVCGFWASGGLNWTRVEWLCPGWVALGHSRFRCL